MGTFVLVSGAYSLLSLGLEAYWGFGLVAISLAGFLSGAANFVHDSNLHRAVFMRLLGHMLFFAGAVFLGIYTWSYGGWELVASIVGFAIAIGLFVHISWGGSHRGLE
ncbi:MAG: hypothetical protein WA990_13490 [Rubrobacteraceae bacterium]